MALGLLQGLNLCASFFMDLEANTKPLADIALLEVLRFQGTLSSSLSSWGKGPSSSTTPFWVSNSSALSEDSKGTTLFLKRWGGSPKSKVVFPENASSEKDPPFDKELSNFKDFNRFLGMSVEGCEEKIVMQLKKLKKMTSGRTLCKKRKKKVVSASRFEMELKRLDCMISYGESMLANRRSGETNGK
ncbi:hypothetical protein AAG906_040207 [Vitis piasezkii]